MSIKESLMTTPVKLQGETPPITAQVTPEKIKVQLVDSTDKRWKSNLLGHIRSVQPAHLDELRSGEVECLVFATNVSYEAYEEFYEYLDSSKQSLPVFLRWEKGTVIGYEEPDEPHAIVLAKLIGCVGIYAEAECAEIDMMSVASATRNVYDNSLLEGDVQVSNTFNPQRAMSVNGSHYASFIFEVCMSEGYRSMHHTTLKYFTHPQTKMVVSIKAVVQKVNMQSRISQIFYVEYRRNDDGTAPTAPTCIISFGSTLHPLTVQALMSNTQVNDANFIGYGRHGNMIPCNARNIPQYMITIPAEVMYDGAPAGPIAGLVHQPPRNPMIVDLYKYVRGPLQRNGFFV